MTTYFLDRDDVLTAGSAAFGGTLAVRDFGLLDAAVARPRTSVFGIDAYADLWLKAAALLHSLARNHALVDGNKRTAWAAAWVFLGVNGVTLDPGFDVDAAYDFVVDAATGALEVDDIARALESFAS
ncbi:toxin Doc [Frondihabitans sucicola]|uniref:Toxin Doc n=1 Tax=Frondihabitans sucicola TaxID=1268041 RepID=A0ABN6Y3G7_9MICO|nr:type II toxin-antitoxin system death-on-curing family toxin [Frondihabitans sucicola]BDZ51733.1 toxin Doc [Frondihabitans sucicola]